MLDAGRGGRAACVHLSLEAECLFTGTVYMIFPQHTKITVKTPFARLCSEMISLKVSDH